MIYLDANIVIRLIEGTPAVRGPIAAPLAGTRRVPRSLAASLLTRMECRILPLRNNDTQLLATFEAFFAEPEMVLVGISRAVLDKAAELRATLRFKTPDAIHMATAILSGATAFLTADLDFMKCTEIPVEVL